MNWQSLLGMKGGNPLMGTGAMGQNTNPFKQGNAQPMGAKKSSVAQDFSNDPMSFLLEQLFGTKDETETLTTKTGQQSDQLNDILSFLSGNKSNMPGGDYLQSLMSDDPEAWAAYEAPMKRQFNEEVVPGIAERFSGAGAGSRSSSAFNQTMGKAGERLSEGLGAQRANLRSGAMNQIMQMLGLYQQPQIENIYKQGQPGALKSFASNAGDSAGMGMWL